MQRRLRLSMVGGGQGAFIGAVHRIAARLDDHYELVARVLSGDPARGTLWASQVAIGCENALRLRVYGSKAALSFDQEQPNELWLTPQGGAAQRLTRGRAVDAGQPLPDAARALTTVEDGVTGMMFIDAVLRSHAQDARWVDIDR